MGFVQLGSYNIEDKPLAWDGYGVIYQGQDTRSGEAVLIKELHSLRDGGAPQEGLPSLGVQHPSLVLPSELLEIESKWYAVLAKPEGRLLKEVLPELQRGGLLGRHQILQVLLDLCDALNALHKSGRAYGALHSAAVVVKTGATIRVHLLGFNTLSPRPTEDYLRDPDTLLFVAPEQLRGGGSPASDIYALGMLIALALGQDPPLRAGSVYQLADAIVWGDLEPFTPTTRDLDQQVSRALAGDLQALGVITTRALQRDSYSRYETITDLRAMLAMISQRVNPLELGNSLAKNEQYDLAAAVLRQAVEGPEAARAYLLLGHIYANGLNDIQHAVTAYRRALGIAPHLKSARAGLVDLYARHGYPRRALDEMRLLLAAAPGDDGLLIRYAKILHLNDQHETALNVLHSLQASNPYYMEAYTLAIRFLLERGDPVQAEAESRKAIEQINKVARFGHLGGEQVADVYYWRAQIIRWQDHLAAGMRRERATAWLEKALEQQPSHAPSHSLLAELYMEQGDTERAIGHFLAAARLDVNEQQVMAGITRMMASAGRSAHPTDDRPSEEEP